MQNIQKAHAAPRRKAKSKPGQRCKAPAVRGFRVCRMHGARGGAPDARGMETTTILINNAGGVVTGTVSMTGSASNSFINAGIWNTLGTNTFAGSNRINNSGTINVFGPTTFSGGLTTLTNGGTLNLAAGSAVGTLTKPGISVERALRRGAQRRRLSVGRHWRHGFACRRGAGRSPAATCFQADHVSACGRRPR